MLFRPSKTVLLNVPHMQQTDAGDCLAACAAMICTHLKIAIPYEQIQRELRIQPGIGAPLSNIDRLQKLGLTTAFRTNSTTEHLYTLLEAGWPTIAGIQTGELPHWNYVPSQHAIVVVGMDGRNVYINDPEMVAAPIRVPIGEFDLAWDAQGQQFAVIAP